MVFAIHQHESAIDIHASPFFKKKKSKVFLTSDLIALSAWSPLLLIGCRTVSLL